MIGIVFWSAVGVIAYVYAGYPLLVVGLAALRRGRRHRTGGPLPTVTLVVAAYNEQDVIGRKVAEALALDYPPELLDIIVAADGSDDATAHIARSFTDPRVTVLHHPERRGKMAALERAAEVATGEILAFSDANNRYTADAVQHLVAPFADVEVGMVTGRKTVETDDGLGYSEGLYWRYEGIIRRAETRLGICVAWNGEILALRRDLFAPAPRGVVNDDAWLALAVLTEGRRIVYEPDAVSIEPVSATAVEERERRTRMFAGIWQLYGPRLAVRLPWRRPATLWALVSHKLLRPVVALAFVAAGAATLAGLVATPAGGGIGSFAPPWPGIAAAAQVAGYGLALVGPRVGGP
ncbi:MAG: glycosyltransferase family 2 protein, partial [Acidimicrobiia bacterium]|nr:glycosyltransferase family 2 protein [Acidimicrobiia bacterium]